MKEIWPPLILSFLLGEGVGGAQKQPCHCCQPSCPTQVPHPYQAWSPLQAAAGARAALALGVVLTNWQCLLHP